MVTLMKADPDLWWKVTYIWLTLCRDLWLSKCKSMLLKMCSICQECTRQWKHKSQKLKRRASLIGIYPQLTLTSAKRLMIMLLGLNPLAQISMKSQLLLDVALINSSLIVLALKIKTGRPLAAKFLKRLNSVKDTHILTEAFLLISYWMRDLKLRRWWSKHTFAIY